MATEVEVVRTQHIVGRDTIVEYAEGATFEEWKEFGLKLKAVERGVQWFLGAWWNYGHRKWSRDAEAFIEEIGYSKNTLMEYGSICNSVKPLIRIKDLTFNHHRLIAPCKPSEQRSWLEKAMKDKWSVSALRKAMRAAQPQPPLPPGTFDVIYADPPWEYDNSGLAGTAEEHYAVMPTDDICRLAVTQNFAEPNAVLFLWATNPFLEDGLQVIKAWGFDYKTNICWVKEGRSTYGKLGFYVYGRHELLLIATRGSMLPDGEIPESIITAPKSEHSRKPDEAYAMIEAMYPREHYYELFARRQYNEKWTVWGFEA